MRLHVWSLALPGGLRIRRCRELWCRFQTPLGSHIAVAVAQACGYSSDQTPSLGTSICHGCSPRKDKREKKKKSIIFPWDQEHKLPCFQSQAIKRHPLGRSQKIGTQDVCRSSPPGDTVFWSMTKGWCNYSAPQSPSQRLFKQTHRCVH